LSECIPLEQDGFYHPASEDDLVCLVTKACREGRELRVRGSAHSVSHAIYTDPLATLPNQVNQQAPPPGDNLNVMLDRYISFRVIDRERRLVECDAGIHLGPHPGPLSGPRTLENSLLYQLWHDYGLTLSETGGISYQTVSGFTATGSSGGTLQFSANHNLYGFRMIDGTGQIYEASRDNDSDIFWALAPSMGLLGVVSKITLQCDEAFNISGQEAITTIADCAVDLFGVGNGKPTLEQFLKEVEYTRLEWWPQRGGERILTWQAQQMKPQPGFIPVRYQEFTNSPEAAEVAISILFTIFGNLDDLDRAKQMLIPTWKQLGDAISIVVQSLHLPEWVAKAATAAAKLGVDAFIDVLKPFAHEIQRKLPEIFPEVLDVFCPLDSTKKGMSKGEPQGFRDWSWQGLPMDNQASDVLVPTEFTEIWLPIQYATRATQLLNKYFTEPVSADEALHRTGTFGWELYGAEPTPFWMNASHTDGSDEWKDGVLRVDIYWFVNNPGNPAETFYPQFWKLLLDNGIPFRLHWGKFQPVYPPGDRTWVDFFRSQYPRWDDFLELRQKKDPNNIFLNDYWRARFGLWDLLRPQRSTTSA
jgi:D-arabinono-1,4-lactone oxidase